jgi:putative sterol carrier protein
MSEECDSCKKYNDEYSTCGANWESTKEMVKAIHDHKPCPMRSKNETKNFGR